MITVMKYDSSLKAAWDDMVDRSRNGTFMHKRDYMDYHSDRFKDFSLVAKDGDNIIAVLPACVNGDTVISHAGLTYGGWLTQSRHFDITVMLELWEAATNLMRDEGISTFIYKPVPYIYHRYPCDEDLYAVFREGGRISESNISTTIDLDEPLPFDRGNKHNINIAIKSGVEAGESDCWEEYWQVLNAVLQDKYGKSPVHSLEEITLLRSRFPENIRLFTATSEGELLAGVVVYYCGNEVAHCQYIASTERGRELKALTVLFYHLIDEASKAGYRYFDFGTSNENGGLYLNYGLVQQKCRLGGRGIVYNTYKIKL